MCEKRTEERIFLCLLSISAWKFARRYCALLVAMSSTRRDFQIQFASSYIFIISIAKNGKANLIDSYFFHRFLWKMECDQKFWPQGGWVLKYFAQVASLTDEKKSVLWRCRPSTGSLVRKTCLYFREKP